MRMRLTVKMQTEAGNRAIEDGSMAKLIEATRAEIALNPLRLIRSG
jgi:hypothetical protein